MRPCVRIAALAALSALTCAGNAQQPAPATGTPAPGQPLATIVAEPAAMMIAACDANGDAIVSRAELTACVAHSFASADTGHKGSIGYIDYGDWARTWLGDANALPSPFEVDSDGDNRITPAELQARFAAIFTRLDRDHDGNLTRAELLTIRSGVGSGDRPPGKRGKTRGGPEAP
ncbi:EF-hand domain-containing protein [Sphingomonas populi]|uniref:EF-hand domain-containing protein n=1 Tax=Sphingomonas populi TaxID=2484750 RepID=A0A4Q6XRK9_9SPHN|nr:EF-hand domain-containing protein [Sphingomonas populi]RZF63053.1 EF-hand domain-containing protein [Sphingomonas populi]